MTRGGGGTEASQLLAPGPGGQDGSSHRGQQLYTARRHSSRPPGPGPGRGADNRHSRRMFRVCWCCLCGLFLWSQRTAALHLKVYIRGSSHITSKDNKRVVSHGFRHRTLSSVAPPQRNTRISRSLSVARDSPSLQNPSH